MSEQYNKINILSATKKKVSSKQIGPKEVNKFDRQQISSFTNRVDEQNQIAKQHPIHLNQQMIELVRGNDAPFIIIEDSREDEMSMAS